jgi:hypothetical protein
VDPAELDNSRLDRLVALLGRGKATWQRTLQLYNWLKASGHDLDDRLCTTVSAALAWQQWQQAQPLTPIQAGAAFEAKPRQGT